MGFRPIAGCHYYLVVKHSNKVLEVRDGAGNDGALIQQNDAIASHEDKDKYYQQFSIDENGDRVYVLRARHSQRVIDIKGGSKDNGAAAHQWGWHGVDHERFRIMDAGDGCYYLELVHSGKLLEVYGKKQDAGAAVVQYQNNRIDHPGTENDHQRFRLVVASNGFAQGALPTFTSPSQMMRDAALGVAGLVPQVGGALKGLLSFLWPDGGPKMIWNQVTQYVDQYVQSALTMERLVKLRDTVDASLKSASIYNDLSPGTSKTAKLTALLTSIDFADRPFFSATQPEQALSYMMLLGNLKLTLLQEQARFYDKIAGTASDPDKAVHERELRDGIAEYTSAARRLRRDLLQKRTDGVGNNVRMVQVPSGKYNVWIFDLILTDATDGSQHFLRIGPNGGAETTQGQNAAKARLIDWRRNTVRAQYGSQLDAILAPALLWRSFDSAQPRPQKRNVRVELGPFGSPQGEHVDLSSDQDIAAIRFYADGKLRGIEVVNRSGARKRVGHQIGNQYEIALNEGEQIVSLFGSTGVELYAIWIETNLGRRLVGGDRNLGARFNADLSPDVRPRLARLFATASGSGIASIITKWDYEQEGELPAASRKPRRRKGAAAVKRAAKKAIANVVKKAAAKPATKKAVKKAIAKVVKNPGKKAAAKPAAKKPTGKTASKSKTALKAKAVKKVATRKSAV